MDGRKSTPPSTEETRDLAPGVCFLLTTLPIVLRGTLWNNLGAAETKLRSHAGDFWSVRLLHACFVVRTNFADGGSAGGLPNPNQHRCDQVHNKRRQVVAKTARKGNRENRLVKSQEKLTQKVQGEYRCDVEVNA
jgi:hypothetical protein